MLISWSPRLWTFWDLVIATVVATIAVQYRSASTADVLIGVAMALALILRRRAPVPVFAVIALLTVLQVLVASPTLTGYDSAVVIAMLAVVTHVRPFWPAYVVGAVVLAGVVAHSAQDVAELSRGSLLDLTYLAEYTTTAALLTAAWLFAYVLRVNRERTAASAERAAVAERERDHLARLAAADERAFIARELHDVVAHSLAVMIAQADGASYILGQSPDQAREAMRTVAGTGRDALEDMHRIVAVLRGSGNGSGTGAPEQDRRRRGTEELSNLVEQTRAAGLRVELVIEGDAGALTAADELTVFRIVQEGLTNVLRHAGPAAEVTVALRVAAGSAVIEVADDGNGRPSTPSPETRRPTGGNGLVGMRERVTVHGGEISAGPEPGSGWRVRATIPLKEGPLKEGPLTEGPLTEGPLTEGPLKQGPLKEETL